ncbi:hypothetical protein HN858_02235 [Candidatus Falkowbacteria bacterium]|nr:hypothetical protein [Candidatus Falkowbacteria bacterium]MBT5502797.1 hypothetical protein [Candidatus Falkowbacteria bacterium]MBT6573433.1 hypothetical protein [Candidatus Falkowbacteria bacterium]MBT7348474.1 hypothetical protein [Candidatus Falkowbacteria bacterium]MBT7501182.1 hypothetical protein [Candidatus Falkowbacteria bacterium]
MSKFSLKELMDKAVANGLVDPEDAKELLETGDEAKQAAKGAFALTRYFLTNSRSLMVRSFPEMKLKKVVPSAEALEVFTKDEAFRSLVFAFDRKGDEVHVAVTEDSGMLFAVARAVKLNVTFKYYRATSKEIRAAIEKYLKVQEQPGVEETVAEEVKKDDKTSEPEAEVSHSLKVEESTAGWMLLAILERAKESGAKKVHLEPGNKVKGQNYRALNISVHDDKKELCRPKSPPLSLLPLMCSALKTWAKLDSDKFGELQTGSFRKNKLTKGFLGQFDVVISPVEDDQVKEQVVIFIK